MLNFYWHRRKDETSRITRNLTERENAALGVKSATEEPLLISKLTLIKFVVGSLFAYFS